MSRWVVLYATTPSGKTLFVCRICGRKSPTPDRSCPAPPEVYQKMPLSCELIYEVEAALEAEKDNPSSKDGSRVLVISEKTDEAPDGSKRTSVVWSSLEERYRANALYLEKVEDWKAR